MEIWPWVERCIGEWSRCRFHITNGRDVEGTFYESYAYWTVHHLDI